MKKFFKVFAICFSSLLAVVIIVAIIVCNVIFTSSKLTPIVREIAEDYITCDFELDTVDLTFFSSFPDFSIHVSNLILINDSISLDNDTLLSVRDLYASVNVREFLFKDNIIINKITLSDSKANIFVDSLGNANYNVFSIASDNTEEDTSDSTSLTDMFDLLDVQTLVIDNVSAVYVDNSSGINLSLKNLNASVKAQLNKANGNISAKIDFDKAVANYSDSTAIYALLNTCKFVVDGDLKDNHFIGNLNLLLPNNTFALNNDVLAKEIALVIEAPLEMNFDLLMLNLKNASLKVNDFVVDLDGMMQLPDDKGNVNMDVNFKTNKWKLDDLIALVPDCYSDYVKDLLASGTINLSGTAKGVYSDNSFPLITANIILKDGNVKYPDIPYTLSDINTAISADVNLNDSAVSSVLINYLSLLADNISISASGNIDDVMGKMLCDLKLNSSLALSDLSPILPSDLPVDMNADIKADVKAKFALQDAIDLKLEKINAFANIQYADLDVVYNDSIKVKDTKGVIEIILPSKSKKQNTLFKELAQAELKATDLHLVADNMMLNAQVNKPIINIGLGEFLDTTKFISAICKFDFDRLQGAMDTISFDVVNPVGDIVIMPSAKNKSNPAIKLHYNSSSLDMNLGRLLAVDTKKIIINASADYDDKETNILAQWNPEAFVDFNQGNINYSELASVVKVPEIKFRFRPNNFDIEKSRIVIDDSDFNLSGNITNLKNFMDDQGLLRAKLDFVSDITNVDQLMALVNGFGSSDTAQTQTDTAQLPDTVDVKTAEGDPFMVPKGVSVALNTSIKNAIFNSKYIHDVNGKLTIRDGVAIVEQMGFTSDAAEMQLTGLYRSDRRNHLFCGLDFHLLKIDIKELINLIPAVDTIVPMLKSFEGKAEFHIAAETYLNSLYEPKMSTLRAAAALEGKDLVLLDSETFSTIAKYLMFSKKTKNLVDSLSVEMTVFRNEIDIYPFLISMDKWQAVLSGRHTLDNNFNYHISLTDCPLPVRLGLDVKGNFDDMKFKLVPCQYKALYKPEKRKPTDERILSLKKLISDALKENVK